MVVVVVVVVQSNLSNTDTEGTEQSVRIREFYRGHYDDVTFKTPLTVFKCLVTKNMHLNLVICSIMLRHCLQRNTAPKTVILYSSSILKNVFQ